MRFILSLQVPTLEKTSDLPGVVSINPVPVLTTMQTAYTVARTRSGACTSPPTVPPGQNAATRRSYRSTPNSPRREPSSPALGPLVEEDALTTLSGSPVRDDAVPLPITLPICSVQVNNLIDAPPTNTNALKDTSAPLSAALLRRPLPSFKRLPKRPDHSPASSASSESTGYAPSRPIMPNAAAELIISSASKPPVLTAGKLSPELLRQFENACRSYFRTKENLDPAEYVLRIAGGLQDPMIADWYWVGHEHLDEMSFDEFMRELRGKWLSKDWEQDIRRRVLGTKQTGAFWEWTVSIRSLNTLLRNTEHHLSDAALLNQMEANLDPSLAAACDDEKISDRDLDRWIDAVKTLDEKITRATHRQKAYAEEAVARATLKRNGKAAGLSEQGRIYNRNTNTSTAAPIADNARAAGSTSAGPKLPRITPSERTLLNDFEGCVKCRKFFAGHRARDCTNDSPPPWATVR